MSDDFEIKSEICAADWSMLKQHNDRGSLFIVDRELDLEMLATEMEKDNVSFIANLVDSAKLRRPTLEEIEKWDGNPHNKLGDFIIVTPFVMLKLVDEE